MKNKNILLFSSLLFILAGCGGNTTSSTPAASSTTPAVSSTQKTSSVDESSEEESSEAEQPVYSATVKDEKDNPVPSIGVQWCTDTMCLMQVVTDTNGYAENKKCKDGNTYYVHLPMCPETYAYDTNGYVATKDNRHVDITIYPIVTAATNEIALTGVYTTTITEANTYVTYNVTLTAGTYNFVSWYDYGNATSPDLEFDPSFAVLDTMGTEISTDDNSGFKNNFSADLTVEEGCTYSIGVKANKAGSFNFNVTKK